MILISQVVLFTVVSIFATVAFYQLSFFVAKKTIGRPALANTHAWSKEQAKAIGFFLGIEFLVGSLCTVLLIKMYVMLFVLNG